MNLKASVSILFLTWTATVTASDRECSDEGYDDICNCDLYKATNCQKPKYYYNNGEGGSYKIKNWDEECAECCCITVQEPELVADEPTPSPSASPSESPSAPPTPTASPSTGSPQWGPTWSGGSWSNGGGSKPHPKPHPKVKPHPKPHPKPPHKAAPKPKAKPSGGGSSGSGGGPSWSSGGWGSKFPSLAPVASPINVASPNAIAPTPVAKPVAKPVGTPAVKSDPDTAAPFSVQRPTPGNSKPTKPSYYYSGEGSSYKQKSASGAVGGLSQISTSVWVGVGIVGVAIVGFIAGLQTGRRRNTDVGADDLIEDTRYERS